MVFVIIIVPVIIIVLVMIIAIKNAQLQAAPGQARPLLVCMWAGLREGGVVLRCMEHASRAQQSWLSELLVGLPIQACMVLVKHMSGASLSDISGTEVVGDFSLLIVAASVYCFRARQASAQALQAADA